MQNMFFSALLIGAATLGLSGVAQAADCEITVEANDKMQFNTDEITVDQSCEQFTVHLKHTGKLPVAAMGHNWVLTHADDIEAVSKDALAAGATAGYLKPDDARVIAHTKMIGGGEEDSITFATSELKHGEGYEFFCSFPGHHHMMHGKLVF